MKRAKSRPPRGSRPQSGSDVVVGNGTASFVTPSFFCFLILFALTLARLIGLHFSVVDLFYDEAQYWLWSRDPALGYFSKPPLLAWIIALTGKICGNDEACIRAASPIFYLGTSFIAYAIANLLYGERTAVWTALTVALATGVSFSSRLISTDVPLLFFWALALFAYLKLLIGGSIRWAITLGVALGTGLLAKYSMIYFLFGIALAALVDADARKLLRQPALWLAFSIAGALIAPNIVWNIMNGFVTFKHTGDNILGEELSFSFLKGIEFIGTQFLVMGPIVFGVFLVLIVRIANAELSREDRLLLSFAIPPLALVTALAFVRGAYGNWAAPAFVPAAIVVTAVMVRRNLWGWLVTSLAIGIALQIVLLVGDATANRLAVPALGTNADIYRKTMLGRALGEAVSRLARQTDSRIVVTEGHYDVSLLVYYLRENLRVFMWPTGAAPESYYDLNNALPNDPPEPILFFSQCSTTSRLGRYFDAVTPLGLFEVRTGPTSHRTYAAFKLSGFRGPIGPLSACR